MVMQPHLDPCPLFIVDFPLSHKDPMTTLGAAPGHSSEVYRKPRAWNLFCARESDLSSASRFAATCFGLARLAFVTPSLVASFATKCTKVSMPSTQLSGPAGCVSLESGQGYGVK